MEHPWTCEHPTPDVLEPLKLIPSLDCNFCKYIWDSRIYHPTHSEAKWWVARARIGAFLANACCSSGVKYFATFLCAIAVYIGPGINLTWLNVNVAPHYRRATAIGFQQSMGNTAGIVAGQIYRTAPYKLGNSFSLGALCVSQVLIAGKIFYIRRENTIKDKIAGGLVEDNRKVKTGDRELDFKYHI